MPKVKKEELKIEWRSPSELKPYEANAKAHPPEQIDKLVRSISEFGWKVPLVVTFDGEVIAGHGRLIAATQMQLQKVPVIVADDLSEEQARFFRITDNRVAESDWITDLLQAELQELADLDLDLSLTGFDEKEIESLLSFGDDINTENETVKAEPEKQYSEIDYQNKYAVSIECETEEEQQSVYENLTEQGYKCKILTL